MNRVRAWAARVDAGTPTQRDRTIDALRAMAIIGVVLGHWLVSATVSGPGSTAALHGASPLSQHPALAPVTWLLETLGPFFFAGGYSSTRALARPHAATGQPSSTSRAGRVRAAASWLGARVVRLVRPVLVLAVVWVPAMLLLDLIGAPATTRQLVLSLVTHPLWFLLAYLVLTVLTPVLRWLVVRAGVWAVLPAVAVVGVADALRPGGLPLWLAVLVVPVAWAVPYLLGVAVAVDRLGRRGGAVLTALGIGGGAWLVVGAGYPMSAVGVPGDGWSNLDPPSLFALALATAQIGVFLLARPWLARVLHRPAVWAPVAALNLAAMTVFLWHQTALLLVTFGGMVAGRPRGLLDAPSGDWPWYRMPWLVVFALVLAALVAVFHRFERGGSGSRRRPVATAGARAGRPAVVASPAVPARETGTA